MNFTEQELAGMTVLGIMMAVSNGEMVLSEKVEITKELMNQGIDTAPHVESFMTKCGSMDYREAIKVILNMTSEKKKYVKDYLGRIMRADGSVDNEEMDLMQLISGIIDNDEVIRMLGRI